MNIALKNDLQNDVRTARVHPQKFALWLGIACMIMAFAGLTSAYIVRKGAGHWVEFKLPIQFMISAGIMLISSLTLHWAYLSFKKDDLKNYRRALGVTCFLGFAFLVSQILGWNKLQDIGIYLSGNPSGSFIYVISFLHFTHVLVGLILLLIAFLRAVFYFKNPAIFLIYRTDSNKSIRIGMLATYWHFVDLLWIYLLVFFTVS